MSQYYDGGCGALAAMLPGVRVKHGCLAARCLDLADVLAGLPPNSVEV